MAGRVMLFLLAKEKRSEALKYPRDGDGAHIWVVL